LAFATFSSAASAAACACSTLAFETLGPQADPPRIGKVAKMTILELKSLRVRSQFAKQIIGYCAKRY
jgi:hypothetical protein